MSIIYQLKSHQQHQQIKFAYVDGFHNHDFAAHQHDFSELFFVLSGSGNHSVERHVYPLSKGDVFVINGDIEHGFHDVNKLKVVNLMFDYQTPFFELPSMRLLSGYQAMFKVEPIARQQTEYRAKLTLNGPQLSATQALLSSIKQEYQSAQPGFEVMLTSLLQQLVVSLSRIYQQQSQDLPQPTLALSRALVFIEQNFALIDINTETIARAAFVSKRQLERLFRQFLNTSPNQYLKDIRLNFASKLLIEENRHSVQHIAEQSGFADSNYFSKCFKQTFQLTPQNYRKQRRN
ncbi:helix-turn-helix domain-containing protein [Psychromonas sp. MME1]|uniref:helix-turn-helix domain-containing protein n=1 Tax=Psychromonas sp. MME1 TaxID=3231032 RepID=UPI0034E1D91B